MNVMPFAKWFVTLALIFLFSSCGDGDSSVDSSSALNNDSEKIIDESSSSVDKVLSSSSNTNQNSKFSSSSEIAKKKGSSSSIVSSNSNKAGISSSSAKQSCSSAVPNSSSAKSSSSSGALGGSSVNESGNVNSIRGKVSLEPLGVLDDVYAKNLMLDENGFTKQDVFRETSIAYDKFIKENEFTLSSIPDSCRYVEVRFRLKSFNWFTDGKDSAGLDVYAFSDLSSEILNPNIVRILGGPKIGYLVTQGSSLGEAEKLVERDILNVLEMPGEIKSFENLSAFGNGEDNAKLLAIYVIVFVDWRRGYETWWDNFAHYDITDYVFETMLMDIAEKIYALDSADGFKKIRENLAKGNYGPIPNFEKYVRNYWQKKFGIGDCTKNGDVAAVTNFRNKRFDTEYRFICRDSSWTKATDIEKDTYKWANGEYGEVKTGDVTGKKYYYDGSSAKWREATLVESEMGSCTDSREADIKNNAGKSGGRWYICKKHMWTESDMQTVDTQGFPTDVEDGSLRNGIYTDSEYKFDEKWVSWYLLANEKTLELDICTMKRRGMVANSPVDNVYYTCNGYSWDKAKPIEYDTYGIECSEDGKVIEGKIEKDRKYYCQNYVDLCKQNCMTQSFDCNICDEASNWLNLSDGWEWRIPVDVRINPNVNYGTLTDTRDGKVYRTVKIGKQTWMAQNLNYGDESTTPEIAGENWCHSSDDDSCSIAGRRYSWKAANAGVCPEGWHLPTSEEFEALIAAVGGESNAGKKLKSTTGWNDNKNGTDDYGFCALPVGAKLSSRDQESGKYASFWSASGTNKEAYFLRISYGDNGYIYSDSQYAGYYVRCLMN